MSEFRHTLAEAARRGPRPIASRLRALVLMHRDTRAALADLAEVAANDTQPPVVRLAALHATATAASLVELPLPDSIGDAVQDTVLIDAAVDYDLPEAIIGALSQLPLDDPGLRFVRVMIGRRMLAARRYGAHVTQVLIDGSDLDAAARAAAAHFVEIEARITVPPAPVHAAWARLATGWMKGHETMFIAFARQLISRGDGTAERLLGLIETTPYISLTSQHAARALLTPPLAH